MYGESWNYPWEGFSRLQTASCLNDLVLVAFLFCMEVMDAIPLPHHLIQHLFASSVECRDKGEMMRWSVPYVHSKHDLRAYEHGSDDSAFSRNISSIFSFHILTLWETRVEDPIRTQTRLSHSLSCCLCCAVCRFLSGASTVTKPIRLTSWLFQLAPRLFSALAEFIAQSPSRSRGGLWYQTLITICCVFEAFLRIDSSALNSLKIIRGDLILEHRWSTKDLNHWLEDEDAQQSVSSIYSEFSVCPSSISFDVLRNTEKCYSILDQESKLA